jgi:hypothetical protein
VLLLIPTSGGAREPLAASGTEVPTGVLVPGEVTCVGGEPTGRPSPPLCSPETREVRIRGHVSTARYEELGGDAAWMFDGANTITGDCDLDGRMAGRCWGSFHWVIVGAGAWDGTWEGRVDFAAGRGTTSAEGHGSGERLEGYTFTYEATAPPGAFTARVVPPPAD